MQLLQKKTQNKTNGLILILSRLTEKAYICLFERIKLQ